VPYAPLSNKAVYSQVLDGLRLQCPERCPMQLYFLMKQCWVADRDARIPLRELHSQLRDCNSQGVEAPPDLLFQSSLFGGGDGGDGGGSSSNSSSSKINPVLARVQLAGGLPQFEIRAISHPQRDIDYIEGGVGVPTITLDSDDTENNLQHVICEALAQPATDANGRQVRIIIKIKNKKQKDAGTSSLSSLSSSSASSFSQRLISSSSSCFLLLAFFFTSSSLFFFISSSSLFLLLLYFFFIVSSSSLFLLLLLFFKKNIYSPVFLAHAAGHAVRHGANGAAQANRRACHSRAALALRSADAILLSPSIARAESQVLGGRGHAQAVGRPL
jgi:hypothetical protein